MKNWLQRVCNEEFEKKYNGYDIYDEIYFQESRKIPEEEIDYVMTQDEYWIVRRSTRKSPLPKDGGPSKGIVYDVFGTDAFGKPIQLVGRLFDDGNFLIFHGRHEDKIDEIDLKFYHFAKEEYYGGRK